MTENSGLYFWGKKKQTNKNLSQMQDKSDQQFQELRIKIDQQNKF